MAGAGVVDPDVLRRDGKGAARPGAGVGRRRARQPTLPPAPPRKRGRRSYWWLAAVAAVALGVVVVDLTTRATNDYRRSTLQSYFHTVDHDVAQCRTGLHDAVVAYVGAVTGTPPVAAGIDSLFTKQAIATCSFTNAGVVSLGSTQPPQAIGSPAVDHLAHQVDAWAYLDAFTLLQDLRVVIAHPGDTTARAAFAHEVAALHRRRARIEQLVASAERAVGAPVRPMHLTDVTGLLPGGRLPTATKGGS